ncbi:cytochrome P450 [Xylariaceae sp. FL0662B]|nr:cytochrome P450 [Xylariaceae sp. FL0662B]
MVVIHAMNLISFQDWYGANNSVCLVIALRLRPPFTPEGFYKPSLTICCTLLVPIVTWVFSTLRFRVALRRSKTPATIPYALPVLGHILSLAWDPVDFVTEALRQHGWTRPLRVKMGLKSFTVLGNPEHVNQVFRSSKQLASKPGAIFAVKYLLGTPSECISFYEADDSGMAATPKKESTTKQGDRIHYHQHHSAQKYLAAQHLSHLSERFVETLARNLEVIDAKAKKGNSQNDWVEVPDLYSFVQRHVGAAAIEVLMGSEILRLHPTLLDDYRTFEQSVPKFARCLPRWLLPQEYKNRDKLLDAIKKWHAHGHAHSDCHRLAAEDPEWDPYFGAKVIKARQDYTGRMKAMNTGACASEDLGLIFAMNSNSVPSIFWLIFEALKDVDLRARLVSEAASCLSPNPARFNIPRLCSQPLLQSAFAETLRLRVATGVMRVSEHKPFELAGYTIEQNHRLLVFTRPIALNAEAWTRAGRPPTQPLEEFQADRFLMPKTKNYRGGSDNGSSSGTTDDGLEFSLDALAGCWLPFGGGQRMCPGRHFAKQQIITAFALLFNDFDIELSPRVDASKVLPNMRWSTIGGLPPVCKVPCRIKKKV